MDRMSIGAFARASRLSPKALRLYDDLGLLTPAHVDPRSGYRFYEPGQLERARLVAWLRRLGMPLAGIREVCALDARDAAGEVRAYWARTETDHSARRDLAAFLVDHLARKDTDMTGNSTPLAIRYAALSDRGLVRAHNQDAAYAGERLLAVADGFGSRGADAASAALAVLQELEARQSGAAEPGTGIPAAGLLNVLEDAVARAGLAVRGLGDPAPENRADAGAQAGPGDQAAGTTLTAMLWTGSQLALVHIGDSRAYLLRDGGLFQITHDHTLVQTMIDEGRLTPEEALSHPQRSLLVRALGADDRSRGVEEPELRLHDALPGDRWLLCSDGLSSVVPAAELRRALTAATAPDQAVRTLVGLANDAGGPDNVACVVADVLHP
ncbi:MerR family transcriptional regulator [Streptomyces sp. V4-01]|uniref:MerR family transcriptional regulator n=1 Tax=Actinacidiphila polyblastidii TaxID=3110430 RepID=A0ABU7PJ19_9ACTN|nr:MerR family transcriptional regulator [Streptomyces sp. V4-01]